MKGIILSTKQEAEAFSNEEAIKRNCQSGTSFWYPVMELTTTTTLTKSEYAELYNIPEMVYDEEGNETSNPAYTELSNTIEVNKYAVVVGNDLDVMDEEGNVTTPENVVDISEFLPVVTEE